MLQYRKVTKRNEFLNGRVVSYVAQLGKPIPCPAGSIEEAIRHLAAKGYEVKKQRIGAEEVYSMRRREDSVEQLGLFGQCKIIEGRKERAVFIQFMEV